MPKVNPGELIWVLCDPETNNGKDVIPATVTGVNDDERGTVNAIGLPDVLGQTAVDLRDVIITASRAAAEKELESHVKDMPKVRDPETDRPKKWSPVDVLPWVKVGYPPASTSTSSSASSSTSDSPPAKKTAPARKRPPVKKTTAPVPVA